MTLFELQQRYRVSRSQKRVNSFNRLCLDFLFGFFAHKRVLCSSPCNPGKICQKKKSRGRRIELKAAQEQHFWRIQQKEQHFLLELNLEDSDVSDIEKSAIKETLERGNLKESFVVSGFSDLGQWSSRLKKRALRVKRRGQRPIVLEEGWQALENGPFRDTWSYQTASFYNFEAQIRCLTSWNFYFYRKACSFLSPSLTNPTMSFVHSNRVSDTVMPRLIW